MAKYTMSDFVNIVRDNLEEFKEKFVLGSVVEQRKPLFCPKCNTGKGIIDCGRHYYHIGCMYSWAK